MPFAYSTKMLLYILLRIFEMIVLYRKTFGINFANYNYNYIAF